MTIPDAPIRRIGKSEIFLGYLKIGMFGFGGVAPWARHIIVEERRWMDDRGYAEVLGLGQILPGPNTMNAAILIGDRNQGAVGALLAVLGQVAAPLVVVTALSMLYDRFAALPDVQAGLAGLFAGAAGLVMGTGLKMARRAKLSLWQIGVAAAGFAAVGLLQWPLVQVVLGLGAVSLVLSFRSART